MKIKSLYLIIFLCLMGVKSLMATEMVNINTADAVTIAENLSGIGPKKAAAIVEFRTKHGPFPTVHSLISVVGIGEKTLEKNKNLIILADQKMKNK